MKDPALIRFGENLRHAREARGWSQTELSDASDVHQVAIARIERGGRNAGVLTVSKLANALRVSAADLFEGIDGR